MLFLLIGATLLTIAAADAPASFSSHEEARDAGYLVYLHDPANTGINGYYTDATAAMAAINEAYSGGTYGGIQLGFVDWMVTQLDSAGSYVDPSTSSFECLSKTGDRQLIVYGPNEGAMPIVQAYLFEGPYVIVDRESNTCTGYATLEAAGNQYRVDRIGKTLAIYDAESTILRRGLDTQKATQKLIYLGSVAHHVITSMNDDQTAYGLGARACYNAMYQFDLGEAQYAAGANAKFTYVSDGITHYVGTPVAGTTLTDVEYADGATEKIVTFGDGTTYTVVTSRECDDIAVDLGAVARIPSYTSTYYTDLDTADAAATAKSLPYRYIDSVGLYVYSANLMPSITVVDIVDTEGATEKSVVVDGYTYTAVTAKSEDVIAYASWARASYDGAYYGSTSAALAAAGDNAKYSYGLYLYP